MKKRSCTLLVFAMVVFFPCFLCSQEGDSIINPEEAGRLAAQKDIGEGKLKIVSNGYPSPESIEFSKILREEYKIVVMGGGCIVTDRASLWTKGYNEISRAHVEQLYGVGILEKIRKKAAQNVVERNKAIAAKCQAASDPNTPREMLAQLARDESYKVREKVAANLNTPHEVLTELAKDPNNGVRFEVAINSNTGQSMAAPNRGFFCTVEQCHRSYRIRGRSRFRGE